MTSESDEGLTDKPADTGLGGFPEAGSIEPGASDSALPTATDLDEAMQDEALQKIEKGEQALEVKSPAADRSTLPPATESGQPPQER